jgi:hypothetical protein
MRPQVDAAANRHDIAADGTIDARPSADGDDIAIDDFIGTYLYSATDADAIRAAA